LHNVLSKEKKRAWAGPKWLGFGHAPLGVYESEKLSKNLSLIFQKIFL